MTVRELVEEVYLNDTLLTTKHVTYNSEEHVQY